MKLIRTALLGIVCYGVGYCTGTSKSAPAEQHASLETTAHKGREAIREENIEALVSYFKDPYPLTATPAAEKKNPLAELWKSIPSAMKTQLVKEIFTSHAKEGYHALRDNVGGMYEELTHFLDKKFGEGER